MFFRKALILGVFVVVALVVASVGGTPVAASVSDANRPSTWEKYLGDGSTCAKVFDGPGSPALYTLGAAPDGYTWTLIVVNAGKPGEGRSTVTPNPAPGDYTNNQTGDVSNVIVCKKTVPPTTEPPITEPPITEPPVTEPPVTEPPVTETTPPSEPPVGPSTPPETVSGPGVPETPSLPATGNTETIAVVAALTLIGGYLLTRAARRPV
jgi:hypothetical protein